MRPPGLARRALGFLRHLVRTLPANESHRQPAETPRLPGAESRCGPGTGLGPTIQHPQHSRVRSGGRWQRANAVRGSDFGVPTPPNARPDPPRSPAFGHPQSRSSANHRPESRPKFASNGKSKSPRTPSPKSTGGFGAFTFPFGGKNKKSAEPKPPAEPAVIRAKLDQDKPRPPVTLEENPLASSVRVRIAGEDGMNYGSGTIIESRPGQTRDPHLRAHLPRPQAGGQN